MGATMPEPENVLTEANCLLEEWSQALSGNSSAQAQWQNLDAGNWSWQNDGLHLKSGGSEWYSLAWNRCEPSLMRRFDKFVISVTVQGSSQAAGLSFGPFRDFLADVSSQPTRLQLEVDGSARSWRFRVDGRLIDPAWWNSAVNSTNDILNHVLTLKARRPEDVVFRDLAFHIFHASCKLSVIITCNRFLQRLRVALRNWCHQETPGGTHEVLVVNPGNPDGTHEHLRAVARSYPEMRICEVAVPPALAGNKGSMINSAIPLCRGEWIWLTDADCVFPTNAVGLALDYAKGRRKRLLYGQRRYLTTSRTDELLSGRIDGLTGFDTLSGSPTPRNPENAPWGYTQIVHRSMFDRFRYPETFDHFAHGDSHFIEICKSRGLTPEQVPGMVCLHLDHPFAWYGNSEFL
jgi:hypothetical protein